MRLRPFFPYFGAKWRSALKYPPPAHKLVVEPFAGSAGYACSYAERSVHLIDRDPVIAGIWDYLIHVSAAEVRALPEVVECVDDVRAPQEARHLIGFWLNRGQTIPGRVPSAWARSGEHVTSFWGEAKRERIALQVEAIRHWTIRCGSFDELTPRMPATWFVDPPYAGRCGRRYRHRRVDYEALARWCRDLSGQVIVCEQEGADWLPFRPFAEIKTMGSAGRVGTFREGVWVAGLDP